MAHFCQLNENNEVIQTIVVSNEELGHLPFPESEPVGIAFCQSIFGEDTVWKQTSINKSFRKHYAHPGVVYDPIHDVFRVPKPFDSWRFDPVELDWVPPTPVPGDGYYIWDEPNKQWIKMADAPPEPSYEVT
jgi:hypothetical protein